MSSSYQHLKKELDKGVIKFTSVHTNGMLFRIDFIANEKAYHLWLDDEYGDISPYNKPLTWLLCLYAIEAYEESEDILGWTKEYNLTLTDEVIAYYKDLPEMIINLRKAGLNLTPPLSYYDYHLGAGDIKDLRNLR